MFLRELVKCCCAIYKSIRIHPQSYWMIAASPLKKGLSNTCIHFPLLRNPHLWQSTRTDRFCDGGAIFFSAQQAQGCLPFCSRPQAIGCSQPCSALQPWSGQSPEAAAPTAPPQSLPRALPHQPSLLFFQSQQLKSRISLQRRAGSLLTSQMLQLDTEIQRALLPTAPAFGHAAAQGAAPTSWAQILDDQQHFCCQTDFIMTLKYLVFFLNFQVLHGNLTAFNF